MELLNILYVTTQDAYLRLDHDTIRVDVERQTALRVPLIHLEGIVCFGNVAVSPALIHRCGEDGRSLVFLGRSGRFKGRLTGRTGGNVLLRRAQHEALSEPSHGMAIARSVVAGKVYNGRQLLLRAGRESDEGANRDRLRRGADELRDVLARLRPADNLDTVRGHEGDGARIYFGCLDAALRPAATGFGMGVRTRRPPRDAFNALLSFLYALLLSECVSALESVGLDPQVGYLHALRPGKPALALDLMEELRPAVSDRLALALANRRQLTARHFESFPGGAVLLNEDGRRAVVTAYQERKAEKVPHRVLDRALPLGLVPHVQARLLARHLRGDLATYPPFTIR